MHTVWFISCNTASHGGIHQGSRIMCSLKLSNLISAVSEGALMERKTPSTMRRTTVPLHHHSSRHAWLIPAASCVVRREKSIFTIWNTVYHHGIKEKFIWDPWMNVFHSESKSFSGVFKQSVWSLRCCSCTCLSKRFGYQKLLFLRTFQFSINISFSLDPSQRQWRTSITTGAPFKCKYRLINMFFVWKC